MKTKNKHFKFLQILFFATLIICISFGQVVTAQNPNINLLVERGIKDYNTGNFLSAVENWQQALTEYKNQKNPSATAVINENLGRAYQKLGENQAAITSLSAAIRDYQAVKNVPQVGRMRTELAQVYSNLGQPQKAIALLCGKGGEGIELECIRESAVQIASKYNDKDGKVAAFGVLGEVYRLIGNYDRAIAYLQAAQKEIPDNFLVLNSLGNAHINRAQLRELQAKSAAKIGLDDKETEFNRKSSADFNQASEYFQSSIKFARDAKQSLAEMRGFLNLIKLASHTDKTKIIDDAAFNNAVGNALKLLENLPDSETKVYGAIDLAYLQRNSPFNSPFTNCPNSISFTRKSIKFAAKICFN